MSFTPWSAATAQLRFWLRIGVLAAVCAAGAGAAWFAASVWYGRDVAKAEKALAEAERDREALGSRATAAEAALQAVARDADRLSALVADAARRAMTPVFDRLKKEAADAKARSDAACRLDADWLRRYNEALMPARDAAVPAAAGGPDAGAR